MPRLARLDTPGLIHHVIIRGIERGKIFRDDKDRDDMIDRLTDLLPATHTECYAWAFLSNHAHFLFRSGDTGLATLMRRLLTGYAVKFSRVKIRSEARSVFCYWAVRELGVEGARLARRFNMSQAAVSYAVKKGEKIVKEKAIVMIE